MILVGLLGPLCAYDIVTVHSDIADTIPTGIYLPQYQLFNSSNCFYTSNTRVERYALLDNKPKCFQILTGSYLSKKYCNLPSYCSDIQYTTITNSFWWGDTIGRCQGLSEPFREITHTDNVGRVVKRTMSFTNSWARVYENVIFHEADVGTWHFKPYFNTIQFVLLSNANTNWKVLLPYYIYEMLDIVQVDCELSRQPDGCKVDIFYSKPFQSSDGLYCRRYFHSSNQALNLDHWMPKSQFCNSYPLPYYSTPFLGAADVNISYPNSSWYVMSPTLAYKFYVNSQQLPSLLTKTIDPGSVVSCYSNYATNSVLDISLGYITGTITHVATVLWNVFRAFVHELWQDLFLLIESVNRYYRFSEFVLILVFFLTYYRDIYTSLAVTVVLFALFGFRRMYSTDVVSTETQQNFLNPYSEFDPDSE